MLSRVWQKSPGQLQMQAVTSLACLQVWMHDATGLYTNVAYGHQLIT